MEWIFIILDHLQEKGVTATLAIHLRRSHILPLKQCDYIFGSPVIQEHVDQHSSKDIKDLENYDQVTNVKIR